MQPPRKNFHTSSFTGDNSATTFLKTCNSPSVRWSGGSGGLPCCEYALLIGECGGGVGQRGLMEGPECMYCNEGARLCMPYAVKRRCGVGRRCAAEVAHRSKAREGAMVFGLAWKAGEWGVRLHMMRGACNGQRGGLTSAVVCRWDVLAFTPEISSASFRHGPSFPRTLAR